MKRIVLDGSWLSKYDGKRQYPDIIRAIMSLASEYRWEVSLPQQHWQ